MLYTIGHSNHTLDTLIEWLQGHGILQLVDIRRYPGSRRLPQFNQGTLRRGLAAAGIEYHWQGEALGGMRETLPASSGFDALPDGAFRAFAMHMNTPLFNSAIDDCMARAAAAPTAIMCAERDPVHCHRQFISDYLVLNGHEVIHITGERTSIVHQATPSARLVNGKIYYDRNTQPELGL